jgi:universal stress protein A
MLSETQASKMDVARRVVVGIPYRKIVDVAEEEKIDLIVMTTHGRTGLSHLVMGSVAEKIVRTAPCPVLTIRPTSVTA